MIFFPLKDLKRADYNPRVMPPNEMESLIRSIETHGFVEPIVVNVNKDRYGTIVGGHQRLTAIETLLARGICPAGIKVLFDGKGWEIPAFDVDLTLEAEKQLNIALNNIHGIFEEDKLVSLIVEMKDSPTLLSTGFDANEIADMLGMGEPGAKKEEDGLCARCEELKKSCSGHFGRTGHHFSIPKKKEE